MNGRMDFRRNRAIRRNGIDGRVFRTSRHLQSFSTTINCDSDVKSSQQFKFPLRHFRAPLVVHKLFHFSYVNRVVFIQTILQSSFNAKCRIILNRDFITIVFHFPLEIYLFQTCLLSWNENYPMRFCLYLLSLAWSVVLSFYTRSLLPVRHQMFQLSGRRKPFRQNYPRKMKRILRSSANETAFSRVLNSVFEGRSPLSIFG